MNKWINDFKNNNRISIKCTSSFFVFLLYCWEDKYVGELNEKENILELKYLLKKYNNIEKIELLPYHRMGIEKYKELGVPYKLENTKYMSEDKIKELENYLYS